MPASCIYLQVARGVVVGLYWMLDFILLFFYRLFFILLWRPNVAIKSLRATLTTWLTFYMLPAPATVSASFRGRVLA